MEELSLVQGGAFAKKVGRDQWRFELVSAIAATLKAERGQDFIEGKEDSYGQPVQVDADPAARVAMMKSVQAEATNLVACLDRDSSGLIKKAVWDEAVSLLKQGIFHSFDPEPPAAVEELVVPMTVPQILKPLCAEVALSDDKMKRRKQVDQLLKRYDKDKSKLIDPSEFGLLVKYYTDYDLTPGDVKELTKDWRNTYRRAALGRTDFEKVLGSHGAKKTFKDQAAVDA